MGRTKGFYSCQFCNQWRNYAEQETHLERCKYEVLAHYEGKLFTCPAQDCTYITPFRYRMVEHVKDAHARFEEQLLHRLPPTAPQSFERGTDDEWRKKRPRYSEEEGGLVKSNKRSKAQKRDGAEEHRDVGFKFERANHSGRDTESADDENDRDADIETNQDGADFAPDSASDVSADGEMMFNNDDGPNIDSGLPDKQPLELELLVLGTFGVCVDPGQLRLISQGVSSLFNVAERLRNESEQIKGLFTQSISSRADPTRSTVEQILLANMFNFRGSENQFKSLSTDLSSYLGLAKPRTSGTLRLNIGKAASHGTGFKWTFQFPMSLYNLEHFTEDNLVIELRDPVMLAGDILNKMPWTLPSDRDRKRHPRYFEMQENMRKHALDLLRNGNCHVGVNTSTIEEYRILPLRLYQDDSQKGRRSICPMTVSLCCFLSEEQQRSPNARRVLSYLTTPKRSSRVVKNDKSDRDQSTQLNRVVRQSHLLSILEVVHEWQAQAIKRGGILLHNIRFIPALYMIAGDNKELDLLFATKSGHCRYGRICRDTNGFSGCDDQKMRDFKKDYRAAKGPSAKASFRKQFETKYGTSADLRHEQIAMAETRLKTFLSPSSSHGDTVLSCVCTDLLHTFDGGLVKETLLLSFAATKCSSRSEVPLHAELGTAFEVLASKLGQGQGPSVRSSWSKRQTRFAKFFQRNNIPGSNFQFVNLSDYIFLLRGSVAAHIHDILRVDTVDAVRSLRPELMMIFVQEVLLLQAHWHISFRPRNVEDRDESLLRLQDLLRAACENMKSVRNLMEQRYSETQKMHLLQKHVVNQIRDFGNSYEFDVGADESFHKDLKADLDQVSTRSQFGRQNLNRRIEHDTLSSFPLFRNAPGGSSANQDPDRFKYAMVGEENGRPMKTCRGDQLSSVLADLFGDAAKFLPLLMSENQHDFVEEYAEELAEKIFSESRQVGSKSASSRLFTQVNRAGRRWRCVLKDAVSLKQSKIKADEDPVRCTFACKTEAFPLIPCSNAPGGVPCLPIIAISVGEPEAQCEDFLIAIPLNLDKQCTQRVFRSSQQAFRDRGRASRIANPCAGFSIVDIGLARLKDAIVLRPANLASTWAISVSSTLKDCCLPWASKFAVFSDGKLAVTGSEDSEEHVPMFAPPPSYGPLTLIRK